jgi:hypothetical protein
MQKTKKEIILETAEFYGSDPSRRAVVQQDGRAKCRYLTEDGRKCAVGRCLIEGGELHCHCSAFDNGCEVFSATWADTPVNRITNLQDILMPEYRGHYIYFWERLQEFHDCDSHFTDTGLSKAGQWNLEFLLKQYPDN